MGTLRVIIGEPGAGTTATVVDGLVGSGALALVLAETGGGTGSAESLAEALVQELKVTEAELGRTVTDTRTSDTALATPEQPDALLVLLSPDGDPWQNETWQQPWLAAGNIRILPALPLARQQHTASIFPSPLSAINACFWRNNLKEIISPILAGLGLTAERPRIFISYRRHEAQALANQLFHALCERNFDVFLDCFTMPPGVDFQRRLVQELGDKSVVLVIESQGILTSQWTQHEIDTAKLHNLGLIGLSVPGGTGVPATVGRRIVLDPQHFTTAFGRDAELKPARLMEVVVDIIAEHDRALARRRALLLSSVTQALTDGGLSVEEATGNLLRVRRGSNECGVVWLCTRPPTLADFHGVSPHRGANGIPVLTVVGLIELLEPIRGEQLNWLSGISSSQVFDPTRLGDLTAALQQSIP